MNYYMAALIVVSGILTIILIVGLTIGIKERLDYWRARRRQARFIRNNFKLSTKEQLSLGRKIERVKERYVREHSKVK